MEKTVKKKEFTKKIPTSIDKFTNKLMLQACHKTGNYSFFLCKGGPAHKRWTVFFLN